MPFEAFHDFRPYLDTASGRQSKQFYIMKSLLGFKFEIDLPFLQPQDREVVRAQVATPNLLDHFKAMLGITNEYDRDMIETKLKENLTNNEELK